jgi:hypothetical protein
MERNELVQLTQDNCIPGSKVIPTKQARTDYHDYFSNKTEGEIVSVWDNGKGKIHGVKVCWDGNEQVHQIGFDMLLVLEVSIMHRIDQALDLLELKLSIQ